MSGLVEEIDRSESSLFPAPLEDGPFTTCQDVHFSNRPFWVKHFQAIRDFITLLSGAAACPLAARVE